MKKKKEKILITGGLGFVGLKLAKKLCKTHAVTIVDKKRAKKKN